MLAPWQPPCRQPTSTKRRREPVLDSFLAYVEVGVGAPIVFLHGNPTSFVSLAQHHPTAAGRRPVSGARPRRHGPLRQGRRWPYRFADHARYLDAWFEALALRDVTLVVHDWGSALGFDWARRHPERVRALVYMEAIVRPVTWPEWPETARTIFQAMRSPAGEEMVLQKNVFVERILPASVLRGLSNEEMDKYREPFRQAGESRAGRRSRGRARSRSTASPPTSPRSSPPTASGSRRARCPSCSSTPSRARSSSVRSASSVVAGPTSRRSPCAAATSCRRTRRPRSARAIVAFLRRLPR